MTLCFFFFNDTATTEIYTLSLHDALPICRSARPLRSISELLPCRSPRASPLGGSARSASLSHRALIHSPMMQAITAEAANCVGGPLVRNESLPVIRLALFYAE